MEDRIEFAASTGMTASLKLLSDGASRLDHSIEFMWWNPIPTRSSNSVTWYGDPPPSSLVVMADGSWQLAVPKMENAYDGYGFGQPHQSARFLMRLDFLDDKGSVILSRTYVVGDEGYKSSTSNIRRAGDDPNPAEFREKRSLIASGNLYRWTEWHQD